MNIYQLELPGITLNDISDEELEYHVGNLDSVSNETVIQNNNRWDDRERNNLVFKLDNLNDKKCRYVSHETFLKKCLDNNLVPNGLKVYVEPSIGNRNDEFLTKWHATIHTSCSLTFLFFNR